MASSAASSLKAAKDSNGAVTLGVGDRIGEGDTSLILDILDNDCPEETGANKADRTTKKDFFKELQKEVKWNVMLHRGGEVPRLVAVQGEVDADGSYPIYRHPSDSSPPLLPLSATVEEIREKVSAVLGQPLNHVLIQHYRSGKDYISEHSDKTVDVVRGSRIVNVSLGAERTMTLRTKKDAPVEDQGEGSRRRRRSIQKVPLPHNSMFVMGLETNAKWLHSIRHDNRPFGTKSVEERFKEGERISLTFRNIGTFLSADGGKIWGQGARGKTKAEAGDVVNGGEEVDRLIDMFGLENHQSDFDWDEAYGQGFDVLHFMESS